jgi:hypothetical protein
VFPWIGSLAAGCSSTKEGIASLEALGSITGDSGHYYPYQGLDQGGYVASGGGDLNVRSYGMRASVNSPYVDLIAGTDIHRIEGQDIQEASLGLRKRFPSSDPGSVYVDAALRRGFDLETLSGSRDYEGAEAGFGGLIQLGGPWFLDLGLCVEWTFGDLDLASGKHHLNEVLFHLGMGFSL